MTPSNPAAPRLLWRYLWAWTLLTLLTLWLTLAAVAYYTGLHEADEITDGQLVSSAELLLRAHARFAPASHAANPANERNTHATGYAPELRLVLWEHGQVLWDTHGVAPLLPPDLRPGHQTLTLGSPPAQPWRVFVADAPAHHGTARRVAVMIEMGRRQAMGRDIAEHIVRPALVLLPLVALLLAWAIRRGLRPLERLSASIASLDVDTGQMLPARQPFRELSSTIHAINTLVQRLQSQLQRERRFTSDVAHELRTPLTAMLLQSRLARASSDPGSRSAALESVEHDALRAGRILGQLLDLARAQSLDGQATEPVDLCALAREVTAAHAPLAYELGQELACEAPADPLQVPGHRTMLELALRNLVDNALRHTPAGTLVEVSVARGAAGGATLTVSDNGARMGTPPGAPQAPSTGMGVGLTLVQRIAEAHGIAVDQTPGTPHSPHRFTLAWPAPDTSAPPDR
jgi:two-component system sensor histidine kinase QseC